MTDEEAHNKLFGSTPKEQPEACAAILDRHGAWLAASLRKRGFKDDEVKSGVQMAFMRLFITLTKDADFPIKETQRLHGWLFCSGKWEAIDERRRIRESRKIKRTVNFSGVHDDEEKAFDPVDYRFSTAAEISDSQEFCRRFKVLWASLSATDKVVLIKDTDFMATLGEVTQDDWAIHDDELASELAAHVALPAEVQRQRKKRLLDKLRNFFKEREDE